MNRYAALWDLSRVILLTIQTLVCVFSEISIALLHTESEYSDVSSPPLLDYPCWISMVYRGTSIEARIAVGPLRKFTCIRSKSSAFFDKLANRFTKQTVISVFPPCLRRRVVPFPRQPTHEGYSGIVGCERRHNHDPWTKASHCSIAWTDVECLWFSEAVFCSVRI